MSLRTQWPYAAKAIVQHEWVVDLLNVWVTFKFSMDQNVKPDHALWLCKVDDDLKPITVSAWQDEWTILLTVPDVLIPPSRVTLEYDGPSENLRITWEKQWEPWGAILSIAVPYPLEAILSAINSNTALDVKFFEDLVIDNAADGRKLEIFRNAAEGKDSLQLFVNSSRLPTLNSTTIGGYIYFKSLGITKLVIRTDYIELRQGTWLRMDGNGLFGVIGLGSGGSGDARLWYDGVNMQINPKAVGTGFLNIMGELRIALNLLVSGAISSGTLTHSAAGPTDDLNVSGVNTVFIDCSLNDVTIGAFVGGVNGQVLHVVRLCAAVNDATLEHDEGTGNQNIFLHAGADETLTGEYGGWTLICNGSSWYDISHAKHV